MGTHTRGFIIASLLRRPIAPVITVGRRWRNGFGYIGRPILHGEWDGSRVRGSIRPFVQIAARRVPAVCELIYSR